MAKQHFNPQKGHFTMDSTSWPAPVACQIIAGIRKSSKPFLPEEFMGG
jgi:hypothetical protein